jgi:hypothetical protein
MTEFVSYLWKVKNENPSVRGNYYPISASLPSQATAVVDGQPTIIRCVRGAKSIFQEDQIQQSGGSDYSPDGRPLWRKIPLVFTRGVLKVNVQDKHVIDYLDTLEKTSYGKMFERVRPELLRKSEEAQYDVEEQALQKYLSIKNSLEEMTSYLNATGVKGVDKLSEDEIRFRVRRDSRATPKRFMDILDAPERKVLSNVNRAIERGLIANQKRSWFDVESGTNEKIVGFQVGAESALDLFVNWLENEGREYYKSLCKRLEN